MAALSIQELCDFYECSPKTAGNIKREIIDFFHLRKKVFVYHVAKYEGVPEQYVIDLIASKKRFGAQKRE